MKFATWLRNGKEEAGIFSKDLKSVISFDTLKMDYCSLLDFIINNKSSEMDTLRSNEESKGYPVGEIQLLAPIPKPHHDIICIGLNYMDHIKEIDRSGINNKQEKCAYFSKRVYQAVGQDGIIENHFGINEKLDYEAEMAFVMGRDARHVKRENAWDYIFGLCCFNDISARNIQRGYPQWFFGKSLDTLTAFGPYIATMDEFVTPLELSVCSWINGEQRQNGNTRDLIFTPDFIIEELSSGMTLDSGSIISTGTPGGVGISFEPHRCMKSGDVVEIEVAGCGKLRNTVA